MIAGPSRTHKNRRVLLELFPSGGVAPRSQSSHPNPMPSSRSHSLNEAASAVVRQAAVACGPVAAMRGEPPEAAAEELAAARLLSPACSGTSSKARKSGRKNTLEFTLSLP